MKTWQHNLMKMGLILVTGMLAATLQAADVLITNNFDTGSLQDWTASGGATLYTYTSGIDYSSSTPRAANLPKSSGTITLTSPLLLASKGYTSITITFNYKWLNGTTTRYLNVEYAADGVTFTKLASLTSGNQGSQPASITLIKNTDHTVVNMAIQNNSFLPSFTDTAKFRFQDTASAGADVRVYVDNIVITAIPEYVEPPTLASAAIVDDQTGGPVEINSTVTYTLTFSKDMDNTTVTASDFGNAGSVPITIGTITETTPGVFTAEVTPTAIGSLQFRVNQSAVLEASDGTILNTTSAILDNTTITVQDTTLPTLASDDIVDDQGGSAIPANTPVTYTLTFSKNMDIDSFDAADFDNAGGASVAIGAITEISPTVFTVLVTPTAGGNLQLQIPSTATLLDYAGNALDVDPALADDTTLTVTADVPPELVSIADDKDGGPVTNNTLITYTVSFNEDIDATTVSTTDFDNAGGASVSIGSITETTPGVFTVEVTPISGGTLQLRIPTTAAITDASGIALDNDPALTDNTIITVDATAPTLASASIADDQGGGPVVEETLITFTVTFSEDMDGSTVTAADFGNAGTAPIEIGTITETVAGTFTVDVTPTDPGTLQLQVLAGAVLADVAGNLLDTATAIVDDTEIEITDGTPPTLVGITDDTGGELVMVNSTVTYTVTFNEDMDHTTVSAADFGNAGDAVITIGAITETSPGVFTVEITPSTTGTLQLQIPTTAVITDVAGNSLDNDPAMPDAQVYTVVPTTTVLFDDFEGGVGNWTFSAPAALYTWDGVSPPNFAIGGSKAASVQSKNENSVTLTSPILLESKGYTSATIAFDYIGSAGQGTRSVSIQYSSNGGASWQTLGTKTLPATASSASYTITSGGYSFTDNAIFRYNSGTQVGGTHYMYIDNILITGLPEWVPDVTGPTLAESDIVDDQGGAEIPFNTPVTYTVTFSEDLDGSTVGIGDFSNAGTAPVTINSASETAPGVVTVVATPSGSGTLRLQLVGSASMGTVITDVFGNPMTHTDPIVDYTEIAVSADSTPPTLVSIADDQGGGPVAVGALVTYTVTFSEPIDTGTMAAGDFSNAGTSAITVGSITEIGVAEYSVEVTPTTEGSLRLAVVNGSMTDLVGNALVDSSPLEDDTVITVDDTPPTLAPAGFVDNRSGSPVEEVSAVTYTVTFSKDIDASTVTAADFGNAGTSLLRMGAISETSPGVFSVQVTPKNAGTLRLQVNAGAVITDVVGNPMDTTAASMDNTTLTVTGTALSDNTIQYDNFESGLGNWTAAGNAYLFTYPGSGTDRVAQGWKAAELYSGGTITTGGKLYLGTKGYTSVTVYMKYAFLNGFGTRNVQLQYAADGVNFSTVWQDSGTDAIESASFTFNEGAYTFNDESRIRVQVPADTHRGYIDQLRISALPIWVPSPSIFRFR